MNSSFRTVLAGAALVASAVGVVAQTAAPVTPAPTAVGTTPQTAADANSKAVQRSDTGTLVRTGPTAADKTRTGAAAAPPADSSMSAAPAPLAPKPDRN